MKAVQYQSVKNTKSSDIRWTGEVKKLILDTYNIVDFIDTPMKTNLFKPKQTKK